MSQLKVGCDNIYEDENRRASCFKVTDQPVHPL